MVNKQWSRIEEDYFWGTAVRNSPKRLGIDRANRTEQSWDQLAGEMKEAMRAHYAEPRRDYNGKLLCRCWFCRWHDRN
jgi:hypothetical protein